MLSLEDQVCSLEHAKRFDEIGITQKSLWYWCEFKYKSTEPKILQGIFDSYEFPEIIQKKPMNEGVLESCIFEGGYDYNVDEKDISKIYSAFTVAELGEMLPAELKNHNNKYFPLHEFKWEFHYSDNKMWHITYNAPGYDGDVIEDFLIYDKKQADARARMLIRLIEDKLITVEEINKCLG